MKSYTKTVRKSCGLGISELSALIGSCHTSQSRIETRDDHRPMTVSLYWLLQNDSARIIRILLDRWLYEKPKNQEHMRLLTQIARRYKDIELSPWLQEMQSKHPEFFNQPEQKT